MSNSAQSQPNANRKHLIDLSHLKLDETLSGDKAEFITNRFNASAVDIFDIHAELNQWYGIATASSTFLSLIPAEHLNKPEFYKPELYSFYQRPDDKYHANVAFKSNTLLEVKKDTQAAITTQDHSVCLTHGEYSCAVATAWRSIAVGFGSNSRAMTLSTHSKAAVFATESFALTCYKRSTSLAIAPSTTAISLGSYSLSKTTAKNSVSVALGSHSHAASGGDKSVAVALGKDSSASGRRGDFIVICYRHGHKIRHVKALQIDGINYQAGVKYSLDEDGNVIIMT